MPKQTQIERAIASLQVRRNTILDKARVEADALDTAIEALKAQQRTKKPRVAKRGRAPSVEETVGVQ